MRGGAEPKVQVVGRAVFMVLRLEGVDRQDDGVLWRCLDQPEAVEVGRVVPRKTGRCDLTAGICQHCAAICDDKGN